MSLTFPLPSVSCISGWGSFIVTGGSQLILYNYVKGRVVCSKVTSQVTIEKEKSLFLSMTDIRLISPSFILNELWLVDGSGIFIVIYNPENNTYSHRLRIESKISIVGLHVMSFPFSAMIATYADGVIQVLNNHEIRQEKKFKGRILQSLFSSNILFLLSEDMKIIYCQSSNFDFPKELKIGKQFHSWEYWDEKLLLGMDGGIEVWDLVEGKLENIVQSQTITHFKVVKSKLIGVSETDLFCWSKNIYASKSLQIKRKHSIISIFEYGEYVGIASKFNGYLYKFQSDFSYQFSNDLRFYKVK